MGDQPEEIGELDCKISDYDKSEGFGSVKELGRARKSTEKLFELVDGGMRLPSLTTPIAGNAWLDQWVMKTFERFKDPKTRQFGENLFSIVGDPGSYQIGHLERYCGPTFTMLSAVFRAKSQGTIVAMAHTHPYFRGIASASSRNREGAQFGPGDWTPLLAVEGPNYLYTPLRSTMVMEYDGQFVTVRKLPTGKARKWRVSAK